MSGQVCSALDDGAQTGTESSPPSASDRDLNDNIEVAAKEEKIDDETSSKRKSSDVNFRLADENSNNNNNNSASSNSKTETAGELSQQRGSGRSSAADNRSTSSSSTCITTATATTTSTSARSRTGSSTTSMSRFKEKRPEPLKLNQANLTGNNQEIPLDLSVKSAGYIQTSGFLGNMFNNLATAAAVAASAKSNQMAATLETPRIVWQDNDTLLVKQRLFSSSTSANGNRRLRLTSMVGDSPSMIPGAPAMDRVVSSPSSMMVCSPIASTASNAANQHQLLNRHSFLSPLFGSLSHYHPNSGQQQHSLPTKPLSASYVLSRNQPRSHSLQTALMSAHHIHYNKHLTTSGRIHHRLSNCSDDDSLDWQASQIRADDSNDHYHHAMLSAATMLSSPFNVHHHQQPGGGIFEAYLRAPRRSCSTENLTSSLIVTNKISSSDHQNCMPNNKQQAGWLHLHGRAPRQDSNCFSYSGQQIAAAAAEQSKSQSPIINVIEGSPSSSNEDTRDVISKQQSSSSSSGKALTPTSVANATKNLLNIRLDSPSALNQQQQQLQKDSSPADQSIEDPLISAAFCREQRGLSWSSTGEIRSSSLSAQCNPSSMSIMTTTSGGAGSSMSSISTTLNTPTLISPNHFKSVCFLPSPTLSPMSSVFELPSPLLMFPPPPTTSTTCTTAITTVNATTTPIATDKRTPITTSTGKERMLSQSEDQTKIMADPSLLDHKGEADNPPLVESEMNEIRLPDGAKKATSDLGPGKTSVPIELQTDMSQQSCFNSSSSEGDLSHLVTSARDKLGRANRDETSLNDYDYIDNEGPGNDEDEESMEIDLDPHQLVERLNQQTLDYKQPIARPATAIPRILVSNCTNQQLVENGWPPAGRIAGTNRSDGKKFAIASQQDLFQREPVSRRALSPQSMQTQVNIYHKERLESSSAPPDIYQGKARPKLKCVTGAGSALDFHPSANSSNQHQCSAGTTADFPVAFSTNHHHNGMTSAYHPPTQPAVGNFNHQHQQYHYQQHCKPTVVATRSGNVTSPNRPNWTPIGAQPLPGRAQQPALARPGSADLSPSQACQSLSTMGHHPVVGESIYLPAQLNHYEHNSSNYSGPINAGGAGSGCFSHSAQHLQGYANGNGSDTDFFLQASRNQQPNQSMSANELHRSAQYGPNFVHPPLATAAAALATAAVAAATTTTTTTAAAATTTSTSTPLVATSQQSLAGHHNQPSFQQHLNPLKRVDAARSASDHPTSSGMLLPDHSISMGELDSLLHQHHHPASMATTVAGQANQSLLGLSASPQQSIQGHQHQQRASSACSLSLGPSFGGANQQHQQHHNLDAQHPHQLDGTVTVLRPAPTSSFRSNSVAGSTVTSGQSHQSHIVAGAAKKYRCDDCSKAFTRSDMLTRHKRLHTGDRPFQCNECKQEFSRSDHLSTHMRTHTGEKPYRCKLCSYSACRKDMITRHMKVHNRSSQSMAGGPLLSSGGSGGNNIKTLSPT